MKKCGIKSELLADYIYGEIEDKARLRSLEQHIKDCPDCTREAAELGEILKAAKAARVDFSGDIWSMQRQNIIRKIRKIKAPGKGLSAVWHALFDIKKLSVAAVILVMVGVGAQYYRYIKASQEQSAIADKLELLQNLEIIERLDFYEKMSNNKTM
jgi:anti-sigma factor RsiW